MMSGIFPATPSVPRAAIMAAALLLPAAAAADEPVDLELVLAVDVSLSMDMEEQILQRDGYVRAFLDPLVIQAIESGPHGRIAVAYMEWAGAASQIITLNWTLIDGAASAADLSAALAEAPISRLRRTSVSGAIDFARSMFRDNGFQGLRRVIDISGDGPNNQGGPVVVARDAAVADGITINGLPFLANPAGPLSLFDLPQLDIYYEDCVIGGPGAFLIPVHSPQEFTESIRNKLVLEIAGVPEPPAVVPASAAAPRIPCDIGERQWRMYMDGER
jgi:hypothetical protein